MVTKTFIWATAFILICAISTGLLMLWPLHRLPNEINERVYATSEERSKHSEDHHVLQIETDRWPSELPKAPFIGIAISGGGSRAANFASAVLQNLNATGILNHVTAISSVSGGSLAAAYYVLKRPRLENDWSEFKVRMNNNFIEQWARRLYLSPLNWFRFAVTEYSRTDLLAELFDETIYEGAKFGDLASGPRLFINATSLNQGGKQLLSPMTTSIAWEAEVIHSRLAMR
jgi:predicted acylesterase/phospholipase RssA